MSPQAVRRLWLVRHAQPQVAAGLCYGRQDIPADPAATRAAAQQLAQALPQGLHLAHSPLQRCELLALYLQALRPDLTLNADARLREMDFGNWEGRRWDALGRSAIDAWTADFAAHRPGGGESLAEMLARVAGALAEARSRAAHTEADGVWITHAGVARCVAWLQAQGPHALPRAEQWPVPAPAFGAWETIDLRPLPPPA
ncbi:MAG: histidine phosphatase family protein [Burkholderiaceae bacterium]|nr:histidine phosphatase family protein [Burkholderiaceae bacterium]